MMNHDFDVYVVNNIMKRRFVKKRDCIDEFTIISNNESLFIKIYDIMIIKINTLIEKNNMKLLNVIYVFDFMINIVVDSIFKNKKLYFDIQYRHLHRNDSIVFLMFRIKAHYVLENNRKFEEMIAFATFIWVDFTHDWHQFFIHVNNEIIQHLIIIVEKMKFINKESVFKTNKCEKCAFFKAHKIVSRFFEKSKTSEKSFFWITYDFVVMNTIMNKNQWISHVTCFTIDFHMIYIHLNKIQIIETFIQVIHIIETKYENKMMFVHSDDEKTLKNKWNIYIVMKEIIFESFAVNVFV